MHSEPDPDWYFEHVLYHAEPGRGGPIVVGPVAEWDAMWRAEARALGESAPDLAAVALRQGFVVRTEQRAALGISRHEARRLVAGGRWWAPMRGTLAVVSPDAADPFVGLRRRHALLCAAVSVLNGDHRVSGVSAAILRGLPTLEVPGRPELTVARARTTHRQGARVSRLGGDETDAWYGIAVTTVGRTIVDVARFDRRSGLMVADAALRENLTTADALATSVGAADRRRGIVAARDVLALASPLSESPLESLVRLRLHDAGFPPPTLQAPVAVPGRRVPYRVDMLWEDQKLVLEVDGRVKYTGDELWREKRREQGLRSTGLRIERVIRADVERDWPRTEARLWAYFA